MSLQPCGKDTKQRPEHRELWESGGLHTGPPAAGGHCGKLIAKRVIGVWREDLGMGCSAGMLRHAAPRHRSTATQHRDPAPRPSAAPSAAQPSRPRNRDGSQPGGPRETDRGCRGPSRHRSKAGASCSVFKHSPPSASLCQSRTGEENSKSTKRFPTTKPKGMKNERGDNSA